MNHKKKRLIAGLSGGVDSSVAAAICQEQGYEVIGVTLKMKTCDDSRERTKACCGIDDNIQARLVANKLEIPHYFLDVRDQFREKILQYAWDEYKIAKTPNPCILCNYYLKFGALLSYAKSLGADGVITGHYAILERDKNNNNKIFKGVDEKKNQTYFLCALTQEQLNHCYMPLGEYTKTEVRKIAEKLDLPSAQKAESQDACFGYKGETFANTLSRFFENELPPGDIVTEDGKIVGKHNGIHNFTIGQRKGHGIALGKPAYVIKIDAVTNIITLSTDREKLFSRKLEADNMNWLEVPGDEFRCYAQIRYNQQAKKATVKRIGEKKAIVEFDEGVSAITAGQAIALYENNKLLAGGWISQVI